MPTLRLQMFVVEPLSQFAERANPLHSHRRGRAAAPLGDLFVRELLEVPQADEFLVSGAEIFDRPGQSQRRLIGGGLLGGSRLGAGGQRVDSRTGQVEFALQTFSAAALLRAKAGTTVLQNHATQDHAQPGQAFCLRRAAKSS